MRLSPGGGRGTVLDEESDSRFLTSPRRLLTLPAPRESGVSSCRRIRGGLFVNQDQPAVHSDPEIMGGTPVFMGTRVPFQTLLDYLEAGQPLAEFLDDFPTVTREQAIAALEQAKEALLTRARAAR